MTGSPYVPSVNRIPVVVSTFEGREPWLAQCLIALGGHATVIAGWELDALRHASLMPCARVLFIQDSIEVLDLEQLVQDLGDDEAYDPALMPLGMSGYNGVYIPKKLRAIGCPDVPDKAGAIWLETEWVRQYRPAGVLYPELHDGNGVVKEHHGRRNLVIENGVVRKWKGTWR